MLRTRYDNVNNSINLISFTYTLTLSQNLIMRNYVVNKTLNREINLNSFLIIAEKSISMLTDNPETKTESL